MTQQEMEMNEKGECKYRNVKAIKQKIAKDAKEEQKGRTVEAIDS